jgi:hypothetical protein
MYAKLTAVLLSLAAICWAGASHGQDEAEGTGIKAKTRSCVNTRRIRRTYIVDDRNLLFYLGTRTVLLNTMQEQCPGLKREGRFAWTTNSGVLCKGDGIAGFRDPWGPTRTVPRCSLGTFQQISREDADALRTPVAVAPATGPESVTDTLPMPEPSEVGADPDDENEEPR